MIEADNIASRDAASLAGVLIGLRRYATIDTSTNHEIKRGPERRGFKVLFWCVTGRGDSATNRAFQLRKGATQIGTATSSATAGTMVFGSTGDGTNVVIPKNTALNISMTGTGGADTEADVYVFGVWEP